MRIASFWAKGFRSLRDVHLDDLGPFNVFYGPNGSGKSNILEAIDAWLRLVAIALDPYVEPLSPTDVRGERARGKLALSDSDAPVHPHDFALGSPRPKMFLEGTLTEVSPEIGRARIAVSLNGTVSRPILSLDELEIDRLPLEPASAQMSPEQIRRREALERVDLAHDFSLIAADRMPRTKQAEQPPVGKEPLSWYFRRGHLKDALFAAQVAPSSDTVQAFDRFRQLMSGPPLNRPPFRAVEDPHTRLRDLREQLQPPLDGQDISLDLAGLGIAQIYWILAQAMLSGARMVAIEEPEAHLHAPTSGRDLCELLERLVEERYVDQLFIATHHHQFALAEEYFDVSLDATGSTQIERRPRDEAVKHFYEPSPYWDTLRKLVGEGMSPDTVLLLDKAGQPIRARDVLASIEGDRRVADQFVEAATKAFVLSLTEDEQDT
jgi:AAA domain, putative AbiEii toxin, Type IV TA system